MGNKKRAHKAVVKSEHLAMGENGEKEIMPNQMGEVRFEGLDSRPARIRKIEILNNLDFDVAMHEGNSKNLGFLPGLQVHLKLEPNIRPTI